MLYTVLILLLVVDCLALMLVVLLQSGKGGGLAAGFGGAGTGMEMMGSRQTATFLHNATRWLGGAFLVIAFAISLLTVRGNRPRSLLDTQIQQEQSAPASAQAPGDLQDMLGGEEPSATGGVEGSATEGAPGAPADAAPPAE